MRLQKFFFLILQSVFFWTIAFFIYVFIKYHGLEEELQIYTDDRLSLPVVDFYRFGIYLGLIIGVIYAIIEFIFDAYLSKKLALGATIIIKSIIYLIIMVVILSVFSFYIEKQVNIDLPNERGWWRTDPFFWNTILYFVASSVIFSLLKVAIDKFGPGVFFNMLLGKYRKPREEERILMFIDLKDSTKIAEQLGHVRYSRFIQDCFTDLNSVLRKYEADIYQYVGDEAVLSWVTKKGFRKNNCVNLFFAFKNKLQKKRERYLNKYGIAPQFKAGLHCGRLMIAEVGTIKKELAFHGDVINTAARIQGLCNKHNAELLMSQELLEKSLIPLKYNTTFIGDIEFKGKTNVLKIHKITDKKTE
ncbi:adenylate/guanylate cyclase domain-containing protein [Seonamhaeicola sp.]|uniref:adenylate/guanylate cyclase domain-containing protein n=1 Tax=Seonamhaeicola sp. TaxID=1912245 RepID=UPI0026346654|nr:adenylate/guanylate cyclase domain-containing protein [Seonamhaeicola sp.]